MKTLLTVLGALAWLSLQAQTYDTNNAFVQTFAGSGFSGHVDGQGTQTMFNNPFRIVADSQGNLFVLDRSNNRIRKITSDATVTTFIGGGTASLPGYGTNVAFAYNFGSMAIDRANTLWITADLYLLQVTSDGYASKTANLTSLGSSSGICCDSGNNIYYSGGNKIFRYRTNGVLEVFAGSGNAGSIDGNGIFSSFSNPMALAVDSADNIYVWDYGNYLIRRVNQNRDVVTIAGKKGVPINADGIGTNASFNSVHAMAADNLGNIFFSSISCIRKMTAATNVVTMAGSFTQTGYTNGVAGNLARFDSASGLCIVQGMIFVADYYNQRIRNITFNPSQQAVSNGDLNLSTYPGLKITGTVGRTYRVESSSNMSNWNTETTLLLTSSPYLWIDQTSLGQKKFYRAFLLP